MKIRSVSEIAERLGVLAVRALLREVAASPKPGLVDRNGTGSHDDMDFMTFADSALSLGPAFAALAREGAERGAADPLWVVADLAGGTAMGIAEVGDAAVGDAFAAADAAFLAELRAIGIDGEARMFAATGGVNTHKGALFLVGLQAAAAGALIGAGVGADADRTRVLAARIVRGVSDRELPGSATNGARVFRAYGSRGVRGEAESALVSLDGGALTVLRKAYAAGRPDDADCLEALLSIMLICDDTTVLHRGGAEAQALVKHGASRVLRFGGLRTDAGREEVERFSAELVERRISPGGSADALAAGIFLANVERDFSLACVDRPLRRQLRNVPRDLCGRDGRRRVYDDVIVRSVAAL
ncbi:MAG: triphosphoribosyl-dephospho-CoA synthase [Treponemataceae bacterium]